MFSICSCLINRHPYQTGLGYVKRTKEQFIFFFLSFILLSKTKVILHMLHKRTKLQRHY